MARAIALVESGAVFLDEDGVHGQILSSDGETWYTCNGGCTCKDAQYGAPDGLCQHRLAVGLYRRATELMHQPAVLPVNASSSTPEPSPKNDCATGVPEVLKRHVVSIQNKPFVRFAGLLELAHQRGLQELKVEWTFNDADLSLAHAVATFPFGVFADAGDATKENVNKKVAPHFRRCALTRASARALRLALGVDLVAVEELADTE